MNAREILIRKRDGLELRKGEIEYLVHGYVRGDVPDYQMAAWLMAVYLRGMTAEETRALTEAMLTSGSRARFDGFEQPVVDKHSTGGVGDKVSLILAPLVAACGAAVPMMSGRSLEHSGGTLDKLQAIPGYRTDLSLTEFVEQVRRIGLAITGQTEELAPADRKIYALRDATATVASVPLVTASILSKKIAEGIDYLVLDVKVGSGAFFKTQAEARALAESLLSVGRALGLKVGALLTDMDQPLGRAVGNWVEVRESVEALHGRGPNDLMEVTLALAREMLTLTGLYSTAAAADAALREALDSGKAWGKFLDLVEAQGGDTSVLERPESYPPPQHVRDVRATVDGYVKHVDAYRVGLAATYLGAGRLKMEDQVDAHAGVLLLKVQGERVSAGEPVAQLLTSSHPEQLERAEELVRSAYAISEEPHPTGSRVLARLASD